MFGLGLQELMIVVVIGTFGIAGLGVLYLVVRAGARAGVRDSKDSK